MHLTLPLQSVQTFLWRQKSFLQSLTTLLRTFCLTAAAVWPPAPRIFWVLSYFLRIASKTPLARSLLGLVSPFTTSRFEASMVLQDGAVCQKSSGWISVHLSASGSRDPNVFPKLLIARPPLRNRLDLGQSTGKSVFFCVSGWVMAH